MEIWLKGARKFQIPVLPASYSVTEEQKVELVDVNALGEIDLGGNRGLEKVSFTSFFPASYDSGYCEYRNIPSPKQCVSTVKALKRAGVLRLIITGTKIRMQARITNFTYSEDDGTGDVNYTIEFTEHRNVAIGVSQVVTLSEQGGAEAQLVESFGSLEDARTEPETSSTETYTVKDGDCLSSIARRLTGSADWQTIYEQNKDTIGGNPNALTPGMVLTVTGARADDSETV